MERSSREDNYHGEVKAVIRGLFFSLRSFYRSHLWILMLKIPLPPSWILELVSFNVLWNYLQILYKDSLNALIRHRGGMLSKMLTDFISPGPIYLNFRMSFIVPVAWSKTLQKSQIERNGYIASAVIKRNKNTKLNVWEIKIKSLNQHLASTGKLWKACLRMCEWKLSIKQSTKMKMCCGMEPLKICKLTEKVIHKSFHSYNRIPHSTSK